jgi:hypothetical protein
VALVVQSPLVEQALQTPEMHVWPFAQSEPDLQMPHMPFSHPWPVWQPAAVVHEQLPPLQLPDVPQSELEVQVPHTPLMQALP